MIPKRVIRSYLNARRDDHRWLKDLSHRQLDRLLREIAPELRLHPKIGLHQKVAIYLGIKYKSFAFFYDMGCVDGDTEYLSPTGWKPIRGYASGEVAQYDPYTRAASFVTPRAYINRPCREMYHFKTARGCDQMVSPEHNMLIVARKRKDRRGKPPRPGRDVDDIICDLPEYSSRGHGDQSFYKVRPDNVLAYGGRFETTFLMDGPGIGLTDAELRVQIAVHADGYLPNKTSCIISIKKERKKQRLRMLLIEAGIDYWEISNNSKWGYSNFRFRPPLHTKTFGPDWWGCSLSQKRTICEEVVHWDGTGRQSAAANFFSRNKSCADFIQFCFSSTRRRAFVGGDRVDHVVHAIGDGRTTNLALLRNGRIVPAPGGRKYCFEVPTGYLVLRRNGNIFVTGNTGKTLLSLELLQYFWQIGALRRALVFVISDKAFSTWERQHKQYKISVPYCVLDGSSKEKWHTLRHFGEGIIFLHYPGAVAMVSGKPTRRHKKKQLLLDKVDALIDNVDVVVYDECFVGDTLVQCDSLSKPISEVREGDLVETSMGLRRVLHLMKKRSSVFVRVTLQNGREIVCTPNHPFFTDLGWVCAGNLSGRLLFDQKSLDQLWRDSHEISSPYLDEGVSLVSGEFSNQGCVSEVLRAILFSEFSGKNRAGAPSGTLKERAAFLEQEYSYDRGCPSKVEQPIARNWARAYSGKSWRKWKALAASSASSTESIRFALDTGTCHFLSKEAVWLSKLLQSGCRQSRTDDCNRVGWTKSQELEAACGRQKERSQVGGIGVESVAFEERICPVDVYSLEIEECPHFFAEGCLVHNSTKAGNEASLTYQLCWEASRVAKHRYALAGMPFGRDPTPLWPQMNLVDHGETLGETFGIFREAFFREAEGYGGHLKYKFRKSMKDDLSEIIQHNSMTYTADECIDLPKFQHIVEQIRLTPEIKDYYREVIEEAIAAKGNQRVMKNAFLRMRQLSSGFIGLRDDETGERAAIEFDRSPKLEWLLDFVDVFPDNRKLLIFYEFTVSGRRIAREIHERFDTNPVWLWSGTKNASREIDRFIYDDDTRFCVVNNHVGAYSLDGLQVANYEVFFESPVSVMDREQAQRRIWRQGQTRKSFFYDPVVKDTVDEKILEFHAEGRDLFKALLVDPSKLLGSLKR